MRIVTFNKGIKPLLYLQKTALHSWVGFRLSALVAQLEIRIPLFTQCPSVWEAGVSGKKTQHKAGWQLWKSGPACQVPNRTRQLCPWFRQTIWEQHPNKKVSRRRQGRRKCFLYLVFAKITTFSKYHITHLKSPPLLKLKWKWPKNQKKRKANQSCSCV